MSVSRSYRITELLGRGTFGSVYLADTVGTGIERPVAIKVLRSEQAAVPGLLERLRDEARMLSMIRHRAIVRVDDLVELDGHWSVVMEYVEGCDVAELLGEGPFPPRVAIAIAEEVANALHVASSQRGPDGTPLRLVHRDVKPGNIRVTAQGEVKLLDFGVAHAEFPSRESGATTAVFGTPTYMAPERFRGEDSHAGDVYALGVTLFEMLAGEPPGQGPMEPERVPPGIKLAPAWKQIRDTSLQLRDLLCAMMARDPAERPPARDCARSLERIRGQIGGMVLEDWAERVVPPALKSRGRDRDNRVGTVMAERPSQATLRPERPRARSSAALLAVGGVTMVGVGVVALVLLGIGGWWVWGRSSGDVPAVDVPAVAPVAKPVLAEPPAQVAVPPPKPVEPESVEPEPTPEPNVAPKPVETSAPAVAPKTVERPATAQESSTKKPGKEAAAAPVRVPVPAKGGGSVTGERAAVKTGIVALGDRAESIILMGAGGVYGKGEVPVGHYSAEVTVASGEVLKLKDVSVGAGSVTLVSCDDASCRVTEDE